jgi:2OG-Fe(II) oxygenase superfamily
VSTTAIPFTFDRGALLERARAGAAGYRSASPFPHAVLDDFLPQGMAEACAEEFPGPEAGWDVYTDQGNTRKLATADEALMGPLTRQLVAAFNGGAMIAFLEELTGIDGLVPDPHLLGGGLHQLNPGGFLKVHADFNRHPKLDLDRRINLLLYLNPGWREEWGGGLELWDERMGACERYVNPIANRVVVFNTTSTSFHGNPRPVACPEGTARRSLAFYYYTNGRPDEERAEAHSTLYQEPGRPPPGASASGRARRVARSLLPPALVSLARRARRTR